MTLYIIGTGLNAKGISVQGLEIAKRCKKVYLENYTIDFPYHIQELKDTLSGKKILPAERDFVESFGIIDEARKTDVALLVYGSPLTATTHISLIEEAKNSKIKCKIIYSASILDAVALTGLQLYKFGKIASMPAWKKSYEPDSFIDIVKDNQKIDAHSLILIDIGLEFKDAIKQLAKVAKNKKLKLGKFVVCQSLGTKHKRIYYRSFEEFKEYHSMKKPYCIVIPGKLHFLEKEILEKFS